MLTVLYLLKVDNIHLALLCLRMVPPFVTLHTFCASQDIRVS